MRSLIVNADDFGMNARVNAAILAAHCGGILTSASLMVTEPCAAEAVEIARRNPELGVGLHVVTTADHALLPAAQIPHLVDAQHRLCGDPFRAALRYHFSTPAKRELKREVAAQFARFAELTQQAGVEWSHVDGHQHFQMHPVVWDIVLDLCDEYGVHRIRVPREEVRPHFRQQGNGPDLNTFALFAFGLLRGRALRSIRKRKTLGGKPIFFCERVYGQLQSGDMTADYTRRLLARLTGQTNEIYFHPGTDYARPLPPEQQTPAVRDVELAALLDSVVRETVEKQNLKLATYAEAEIESTKNTKGHKNRF